MPGLRSFEQERAPNGQFGPGDGSGSSAGWNGQGIAPSLEAFSKHWEDQGLQVAVYQKSGNGPIVLSQVVVPKDQRSQGIGSKFMGGLTKYADAHGLAIHLSPSKDFGGTVSRLTDFYKGHGFVENKGRNKDYEVSESMYRLPQGQTASGVVASSPDERLNAMLHMTNQHPAAPGVWCVCDRDTDDIVQVIGPNHEDRYTAIGVLAAAYDWDSLTAAGTEAVTWEADPAVAYEGLPTSDKRQIDHGALAWRQFPLPLMANFATTREHQGAVIAGAVDNAELRADGLWYANGRFDTGEDGVKAAGLVRDGVLCGVSVDMTGGEMDVEILEFDAQGAPSDYLEHYVRAEGGGLTITPFPAFAGARIKIAAPVSAGVAAPAAPGAANLPIAAAGGPVAPPVEWFQDPLLSGPTPLTISDDGRIFGHIATWGVCHIGMQNACVEAPRSATNYAYFTTGAVKCADGCEIPVGTLTLGTGHADLGLDHRSTASHYDNTGTGVADVAVGEDNYGVWVAGACRPMSDEDLRAFRASSPSGDWRRIGGNMELVAVLAVNVPGFPVVRPRARVASGEPFALVAAVAPTVESQARDRVSALESRLETMERLMSSQFDRIVADIDQSMHATFRDIPTFLRKKAEDSGAAMPGGRFPILNATDLKAAIASYGRATDKAAVKAHIVKRAKALGLVSSLPKDWA